LISQSNVSISIPSVVTDEFSVVAVDLLMVGSHCS